MLATRHFAHEYSRVVVSRVTSVFHRGWVPTTPRARYEQMFCCFIRRLTLTSITQTLFTDTRNDIYIIKPSSLQLSLLFISISTAHENSHFRPRGPENPCKY